MGHGDLRRYLERLRKKSEWVVNLKDGFPRGLKPVSILADLNVRAEARTLHLKARTLHLKARTLHLKARTLHLKPVPFT